MADADQLVPLCGRRKLRFRLVKSFWAALRSPDLRSLLTFVICAEMALPAAPVVCEPSFCCNAPRNDCAPAMLPDWRSVSKLVAAVEARFASDVMACEATLESGPFWFREEAIGRPGAVEAEMTAPVLNTGLRLRQGAVAR